MRVATQNRKTLVKPLFWWFRVIQGHRCWHS